MTLTVALVGLDGIVAATDSRGTFGDPRSVTAQNDTMQKLFALAPHVVVTIAGSAELGSRLMAELEPELKATELDGATAVMNAVRDRTRQRYGEWFQGWQIQPSPVPVPPVRPDLTLLVVGYDPIDGAFREPRIYQLVSAFDFAPMLTATGFGLQGVAQYALYLLNRLYMPKAPINELQRLAAYVITETASQDGKVGGPVQMATVTGDGCMILTPSLVEGIVNANATLGDRLRSSFFAGASQTGSRGGPVRS